MKSTRGFSLTELMVVLAIAVIVLSITIPGLHSLVQRQRVTTAVNDFFMAINLTRSEAIQRGTRVDLVPADGASWNSGWVVLIDENNNLKPDDGENILYSHGPVPRASIRIESRMTDRWSSPYLAYNGSGRTQTDGSSQSSQSGSFSFVSKEERHGIVINFLGRPRVCHHSDCPK